MNEIPTVKVVASTPLGYAIINESDYDKNIHELYDRPIPESPESESDLSDEVEIMPNFKVELQKEAEQPSQSEPGLSSDNQEPPPSEPRRRKPRPSAEPGIE